MRTPYRPSPPGRREIISRSTSFSSVQFSSTHLADGKTSLDPLRSVQFSSVQPTFPGASMHFGSAFLAWLRMMLVRGYLAWPLFGIIFSFLRSLHSKWTNFSSIITFKVNKLFFDHCIQSSTLTWSSSKSYLTWSSTSPLFFLMARTVLEICLLHNIQYSIFSIQYPIPNIQYYIQYPIEIHQKNFFFYGTCMEERTCAARLPHINGNVCWRHVGTKPVSSRYISGLNLNLNLNANGAPF